MGFAAEDRARRESAVTLARGCRGRGISSAQIGGYRDAERAYLARSLGVRTFVIPEVWDMVRGMLTVNPLDDPFTGTEHGRGRGRLW